MGFLLPNGEDDDDDNDDDNDDDACIGCFTLPYRGLFSRLLLSASSTPEDKSNTCPLTRQCELKSLQVELFTFGHCTLQTHPLNISCRRCESTQYQRHVFSVVISKWYCNS